MTTAADTPDRPEPPGDLPAPVRPHDDLGFEELASKYNFEQTSDRRAVFARLVIRECERAREQRGGPVRVLDIGCGRGIGLEPAFTHAVKKHADELWGIEPDEGVEPEEGLFDNYQHALMETAELPENHFDVAYSFLVMEHVADPAAFMRAVAKSLKPGGVHMFVTPNGRHYFALATRSLKAMRLDELVLKIVRSEQDLEEYHYPVQYKCNTPGDITRAGERAGFVRSEFAFIEEKGPEPYMRGPLRPFFKLLQAKRRRLRKPELLLTLIARQTRGGD